MKHILLFLALCCTAYVVKSQTTYMSLHTSGRFDKIISVSSGGYLTSGFDSNYAHQYVRWDAGFHPIWKLKLVDTSLIPFSNVIVEANDGNFYLGASSNVNNGSFTVTKVSSTGSVLWQKRYTGSAVNYSLYAPTMNKAAGSDNGFVFGTGSCSLHNVFVKCDANGNINWQKSYDYPLSSGVITCMSIVTENNGYVLSSGFNIKSVLTTRIDTSGNILNYSAYTYTWTAQLMPQKLVKMPGNNGYAMIAQTNNSNNQIQYVAFYNNALSMTSFTELNVACQQFTLYDITPVDNGTAVVVNGSVYDSSNTFRTAAIKISNTGNVLWKRFGKNSNTASVSFQHTEFTGVVANGNRTVHVGGGLYEGPFVAILDSMGNGICNEMNFTMSALPRTLIASSDLVTAFVSNAVAINTTLNYNQQVGYTPQIFCGSTVEGITELTAANIDVYPNPASDKINIVTHQLFDHEANYSLFAIDGKLYRRNPYTNGMSISINNLPEGVYILMITDSKQTARAKVVVSH
ncbi:MAG: hypothetical protein RIQ62_438 [Bacteroidota bacterium]|jgi:hypothetical protein